MHYMWNIIHAFEYVQRICVRKLLHRERISKYYWHAITPIPCWAPHFRMFFSNPTPSGPRISSAATMRDETLSASTAPPSCSLQLLLALSFLSLGPSLPQFPNSLNIVLWSFCPFAESWHPDLWTCVCDLLDSSSCFAFLIETWMDFSFRSLSAILVVITTALPLLLVSWWLLWVLQNSLVSKIQGLCSSDLRFRFNFDTFCFLEQKDKENE